MNIVKYLLGNIWYFYGCIIEVKKVGVFIEIVILSVLIELLLMVVVVLIVVLVGFI